MEGDTPSQREDDRVPSWFSGPSLLPRVLASCQYILFWLEQFEVGPGSLQTKEVCMQTAGPVYQTDLLQPTSRHVLSLRALYK